MSKYRDGARIVATETRWTFFRFFSIFATIVILLSLLFFGMKAIGLIGKTAVERVVFEQSYQRSESLKSQIAMDEANLTEINAQLMNPNLDENTRFNLEAQARAARIRIATAKGQQ